MGSGSLSQSFETDHYWSFLVVDKERDTDYFRCVYFRVVSQHLLLVGVR